MKKLFCKELRLVAHPTSIVFSCLGGLVLVPAYPYSVVFLFGCLAPYITFWNARETNDAWYTATLPVTKRQSVAAKCLLTAAFQLFQLALAAAFAVVRHALAVPNNPVGIDPTPAFFGCGLLIEAVFDFVFLTTFYKSGYRVGRAFLAASVPLAVLMAALESCAHIPALAWMDALTAADVRRQLPILLGGMVFYPALLTAACRVGAARFERVDL